MSLAKRAINFSDIDIEMVKPRKAVGGGALLLEIIGRAPIERLHGWPNGLRRSFATIPLR
jgi:hypothetical protein